jgi:hypothetical protein
MSLKFTSKEEADEYNRGYNIYRRLSSLIKMGVKYFSIEMLYDEIKQDISKIGSILEELINFHNKTTLKPDHIKLLYDERINERITQLYEVMLRRLTDPQSTVSQYKRFLDKTKELYKLLYSNSSKPLPPNYPFADPSYDPHTATSYAHFQ